MATSHDLAPHGGDNGVLELLPPEGGFELYRYKNADEMKTKNWHGYYWARRTEEGDYEIRSVPSMLGEHSMPEGIMPKEGFEELYEKGQPRSSPQATL
jgi:hypothetical protein